MNNFTKYSPFLFLLLVINMRVKAQQYDNIYRAADANMLEVNGNDRIEHILKGATIIFPNGSSQLNVAIHIPFNAVDNKPLADTEMVSPGYQFQLIINIDPVQIQEVLTSSKTFLTNGFLTLNNISKPVAVTYMPVASGTEENGNFNIYLVIQFNAAGFNLGEPNNNTQFVIKINDAKVNRV